MTNDALDDIQVIYSGGECGPLALFLNKKFNCEIYVITGIKDWDGKTIPRCHFHYFVKHEGVYFDIYGWHETFKDVNANFTDFTPDCKLQFDKIDLDKVEILPVPFNHSQKKVQKDWNEIICRIWDGSLKDKRIDTINGYKWANENKIGFFSRLFDKKYG